LRYSVSWFDLMIVWFCSCAIYISLSSI
jgi:hypothetical protein